MTLLQSKKLASDLGTEIWIACQGLLQDCADDQPFRALVDAYLIEIDLSLILDKSPYPGVDLYAL